ncbi:MAG: HAD family phosphatase [Sphingobacteriaceae bacterium]|nr:HAD family phosphatase [Sphingobacteriaceae bacterium]
MAVKKIKNIIFDLGGVIINLDTAATIKGFVNLGINDFENIYSQLAQTNLFDQFDKGLITENYFFNSIKNQFDLKKPLHDLEKAWNAMLLDFPKQRLDALKKYKESHRTFLLSNTNETHIREFHRTLHQSYGMRNLNQFFEKVYFSCRVNMRKPDKEIFELVLKQNHLDPAETLFIDDTMQHVEGAKRAGLHASLVKKDEEFEEVLKKLL